MLDIKLLSLLLLCFAFVILELKQQTTPLCQLAYCCWFLPRALEGKRVDDICFFLSPCYSCSSAHQPISPSATAVQCLLLYSPRNDPSTRQLSLLRRLSPSSNQDPAPCLKVLTPASSLCVLPRMIAVSYFLSGFLNFQPSNTNLAISQ